MAWTRSLATALPLSSATSTRSCRRWLMMRHWSRRCRATWVFRGRDDLRVLLGAVYGTVTGLRWTRALSDGDARVVIGECRVGSLKLGDVMILDVAADGRIRRISPHLRPWLAVTVFALMLGPKLARHPGVLIRALRAA